MIGLLDFREASTLRVVVMKNQGVSNLGTDVYR